MTDYNVTTSTFTSTLASAAPGDRLILANGNYTNTNITKVSSGEGVTIEAENALGAVFSASDKTFSGSYLHLRGILSTGVTRFTSLSNSTAQYCQWGYFAGVGNSYVTVKYNRFTWLQHWFATSGANENHHITIECNLWKHSSLPLAHTASLVGNDFLKIDDGWDYDIVRNTFWDQYFYWDGTGGDGPHGDFIQIGGGIVVRRPYNVRVQDNYFWDTTATHAASNAGCAGINMPVTSGCIVEGNLVANTHPNSIQILHAATDNTNYVRENCIVSGPTQAPYTGGLFTGGPVIIYPYSSTGTLNISSNVCASYQPQSGIGATSVSGNVTGVSGSDFDWTDSGASISDWVPNTSGTADVSGRWRDRVDAIIGNTEDFYHPTSGLILAGGGTPAAPVIPGLPTISGSEAVNQILTATASTPVTGYPTPTRTWQWYNSVSGAIAGATSQTYQLQASDEGDTVYVIQTETNTEGNDTAQSSNTGTIGAAPTAPAVSSFSPADNATGVAVDATLTITFDTTMALGTGTINLWRSDSGIVDTWNVVTDAGTGDHSIHADGNDIILTGWAAWPMHLGITYSILIDDGALESTGGVAFPGISDTATWNFTTTSGVPSLATVTFGSGDTLHLGSALLLI